MKKFIRLLLVLMLCCYVRAENSQAITYYEKHDAQYQLNDDGQTLTLVRANTVLDYDDTLIEEYNVKSQVEIDGKIYRVTRAMTEIFHTMKVKKVVYSEGIEEIEIPARQSVEEIVIPSTVKSLCGVTALAHVKTITISPNNPYYMAKNNMIFSKDGTKLIGVGSPKGKVEIPNGVKKIGALALAYTDITNIVLPDSLVSIGEEAFAQCPSLTQITIGKFTKNIATNAFYGTNGLKDIAISKKNPHIRCIKGAIYTKNKKTLLLAGAARGILILPKKTSHIQKNAFYGNKTVETVFIMNSMKKIPSRAFAVSNVEDVVLPDSVKVIGKEAFAGCYKLESIELPDSVRIIGEGAFSSCQSMRITKLPKSLKTIKKRAFYQCGFSKLVIPKSVKVIEEDALCTTIETLIFRGKKLPKMAKQEECKIGAPKKTDPEDDDYDTYYYDFVRGIGVVKVPKQSYKKYCKVLKKNMEYRKLVKLKK